MATQVLRPFYDIVAEGPFAPDQIVIEERPGVFKKYPEAEAFRDGVWACLTGEGGSLTPWSNDLKPSRDYFYRAYHRDGKLICEIDPKSMSYRDYRGSRYPVFRERFGEVAVAMSFNAALAVIAKDATGEDCVLVCHRKKGDVYLGYITVGASGAIDPGETPAQAAVREANEEAGVQPEEISMLMCVGILRDPYANVTEPMFIAETDVPVEELLKRKGEEYDAVHYVPVQLLCQRWLDIFPYAMTENAIGFTMLIGKMYYGQEWFDNMEQLLAARRELAPDAKSYRSLSQQAVAGLAEALAELRQH